MNEGRQSFEVLVVGGGPAGMAAAVCAAESGRRVALADDNPSPGGQIWRGEQGSPGTSLARDWYKRFEAAGVEYFSGYRVFGMAGENVLLAETFDGAREVEFDKLILATGARERFLPFPGWTLPNVMGAGGLQALVKSGVPITGRSVAVAGTGPLLLAVAAYLKDHGANVVVIAEQANWSRLGRFGVGLAGHPAKLWQAAVLRRGLKGVPFVAHCWPVAAEGNGKLESVTLRSDARTWKVACDYLACGFHLVPNVELAQLLGCELRDGFVKVDETQRTSVEHVFCAGEPTGIGGLELALVEGQIAGYATAGRTQDAGGLFATRKVLRRFASRLEHAFALDPALRGITTAETLVCRCEDVGMARLKEHRNWRSAKLHTRCGMGPCQGRVCGPAVEFLLGWKVESVRPPIFPARVGSLATTLGLGTKR